MAWKPVGCTVRNWREVWEPPRKRPGSEETEAGGSRKFIVKARAGAGLVRRDGLKAQGRVLVSEGHRQG